MNKLNYAVLIKVALAFISLAMLHYSPDILSTFSFFDDINITIDLDDD